jgi:hypothetical protein
MNKNRDKYPPLLGFVDLLLNLAVAFAFLFMLSQILINVNKKETPAPEREGVFIIEARWNDGVDADVDLWAKAPNNERSGFMSRDVGMLSLLRDDLGNTNDRYTDENGEMKINPINREEITVRTPIPGKYVVNLHYFRTPYEGEKTVKIRVVLKKIKENTILVERELEMSTQGTELTAFTFTLDNNRNITETEQPDAPILWVVNSSSGVSRE